MPSEVVVSGMGGGRMVDMVAEVGTSGIMASGAWACNGDGAGVETAVEDGCGVNEGNMGSGGGVGVEEGVVDVDVSSVVGVSRRRSSAEAREKRSGTSWARSRGTRTVCRVKPFPVLVSKNLEHWTQELFKTLTVSESMTCLGPVLGMSIKTARRARRHTGRF